MKGFCLEQLLRRCQWPIRGSVFQIGLSIISLLSPLPSLAGCLKDCRSSQPCAAGYGRFDSLLSHVWRGFISQQTALALESPFKHFAPWHRWALRPSTSWSCSRHSSYHPGTSQCSRGQQPRFVCAMLQAAKGGGRCCRRRVLTQIMHPFLLQTCAKSSLCQADLPLWLRRRTRCFLL